MTDFKDKKKLRLMCNAERQFSSIVNGNFLLREGIVNKEGFCLKIMIIYSTAILDNGKFS